MTDLREAILPFLNHKKLSLNSQKSYHYDLEQFCEYMTDGVDKHNLRLYQESLVHLKPAARKRKLSAVNQFLYFLYENQKVDHFYKLKSEKETVGTSRKIDLLDLSKIYEGTPFSEGQLISLLILELGLTPSEIARIEVAKIDKEFRVMTLVKDTVVRVISLPDVILPYLEWKEGQIYLFDKSGQSYSRQWFFNQLTMYLESIGLPDLTAQKLREQHIVREKHQGTSLLELVSKLGLKSPITLEKYYK